MILQQISLLILLYDKIDIKIIKQYRKMFLTDSRVNSTPSQKLKRLQTLPLPYKPHTLPQCSTHAHTPQSLICLSSSCNKYLTKYCPSCEHNRQHLQQLTHLLPVLSQFLQKKWSQISHDNAQVQHEWLVCQTNVQYCIDVLGELLRVIKQSKNTRLHKLPVFQHILETVLNLYEHHVSFDDIVDKIALLHDKYGILDKPDMNTRKSQESVSNIYANESYGGSTEGKQNYKFINEHCIDEDIKFRLKKWLKSGEQTKKFTEQALAFSQRLSQSIQQKLKHQKHRKNTEQLINKKISTLAELFKEFKHNKNQSVLFDKIEEIPALSIELPQNHKTATQLNIDEQSSFIVQNLSKFKMLKSLTIKNKNSKIKPQLWQPLINNFQSLKNLKQLTLSIRNQDLLDLIPLLQARPNAVRQISTLHLTINDEHKLDLKNVALFCNCYELRELYLQLSRNSITKGKYLQFLGLLRFKTSLSHLAMDVLELVLTKNKITESTDIRECTKKFEDRYKQIKKSSVAF